MGEAMNAMAEVFGRYGGGRLGSQWPKLMKGNGAFTLTN